jgi:thiamine biosynthesis lipoprotein
VGVRHPLRTERRMAEIRLRDRALSTSGGWAQSFWHQGRRYGHIIDPRTGRPADRVLSATVVAPTATLAEALSTAFYVMGHEAAVEYCRGRPELGVVLVCPVRHSGGTEVHSLGLSEDELTLLS